MENLTSIIILTILTIACICLNSNQFKVLMAKKVDVGSLDEYDEYRLNKLKWHIFLDVIIILLLSIQIICFFI